MEKKNWKHVLYLIVEYLMLLGFVIGIGVILYMAAQTGETSSQQSGAVTEVVQTVIETTTHTTVPKETLDPIVRKLIGHYMLFLVTGLCGLIYCLMQFRKDRWRYISIGIETLIGFIVAMASEWIQSVTPDRGPSWNDVGIDTAGFVTTIVIALVVLVIHQIVVSKKNPAAVQN